MAYKAGKALKLKIGGTEVVGLRSKELNYEADMAEATTQDSEEDWKEYLPLQKGGTISADGLYNPDLTGVAFDALVEDLKAGTELTVYFGGIENGDTYEEASAYINSVTWTGDYADIQNVSVEMTISGKPTTNTVSG